MKPAYHKAWLGSGGVCRALYVPWCLSDPRAFSDGLSPHNRTKAGRKRHPVFMRVVVQSPPPHAPCQGLCLLVNPAPRDVVFNLV